MRFIFLFFFFLGSVSFAQTKPPQFVMLAFDGSKSLEFWKESREFAKASNARFTYFISGVYFLSPANRTMYRPPTGSAGRSAIGWGKDANDISLRMEQVELAKAEGNEIASHVNGHFDGSKWSRENWLWELNEFRDLLLDAVTNNHLLWSNEKTETWQKTVIDAGHGLRAPLLATSPGLWQALADDDVIYDTSSVAQQTKWPTKSQLGLWSFPLVSLRIAGSCKATLSMDYNFYVAQSGAHEASANAAVYEDQMYRTYMNYFERSYNGNRAPVNIGHHFSKWNGGAYWKAMKRFAQEVCSKPDVRCVTYSELTDYLEKNRSDVDRWIASAEVKPDNSKCGSKTLFVPGALEFDPPAAHEE